MYVDPETASRAVALMDYVRERYPAPPLVRVGLTVEEVRLATGRACGLSPTEARRALARAWRKNSHGGGPIPAYVVGAMFAEYQRCGSLSKAAAVFGRTKQDLAYVFKKRGLPLKSRGGPNHRRAA